MNYWFTVFFFVFCRSACMKPDNRLQIGLSFLDTAKTTGLNKADAQMLCLCALDEFIKAPSNPHLNETIKLYNVLQKKIGKKTYSRKQLESKKKLIILIQSKSCASIKKLDSKLFDVLAFCAQVNKQYNLNIPPSSQACDLALRLIEADDYIN